MSSRFHPVATRAHPRRIATRSWRASGGNQKNSNHTDCCEGRFGDHAALVVSLDEYRYGIPAFGVQFPQPTP